MEPQRPARSGTRGGPRRAPPAPGPRPGRLPGSLVLLGALLLFVPACATAGGGAGEERDRESVEIRVTNDLVTPTTVSVLVVSEDGTERVLGQVAPDSSATFEFRPFLSSIQHRLVAESTRGRSLVSEAFTPARLAGVSWRLETNRIRLRRAPPDGS